MRSLVLFSILLLPAQADGQVRRGNAGAGRVNETTRIINDCEQRTNSFKKTLDRALGRSNVRAGEAREEQLNRNASNLESALDKVGDSWNRDHSIDQTRAHVRAAIGFGNDINVAMRNWNMGGDAESQWSALRAELNRLATTFNLPHIR